ncbi:MAG: hypothetical protein MJ236_03145 [Clostridia bacterium]|nr:hypothetical protein [Clostridia bacterium]
MADVFAAIASNDIKASRGNLVKQLPVPKSDVSYTLNDTSSIPTPVYKKMSTKAELDMEICNLKNKYSKFLMCHAPKFDSLRQRTYIDEFDFRVQNDKDIKNLSKVIMGEGSWEKVKIPHYGDPVGKGTTYYRTDIYINNVDVSKSYILHFDGVDYIAKIFVNGNFVGQHEGFFAPFELDISEYISNGSNSLLVVVENDYVYAGNNAPTYENERLEGSKLYAATGLGFDNPNSGWHHCPPGMGIYQRVYLETREKAYISSLWVRPMVEKNAFEIWCEIYNTEYLPYKGLEIIFSLYGHNFTSTVFENKVLKPQVLTQVPDGRVIQDGISYDNITDAQIFVGENQFRFVIPFKSFKLWSQDEPYLYELQATLTKDGAKIDNATTTFGMRSFVVGEKDGKNGMFYLNGTDMRLRGANTMGYEQLDVYRDDKDQLIYDMLMAKACNMNFLRITQRPVQKEIYEICDRLGILIQTDLPLFTNVRRTKFAEVVRQAEEMEKLIRPYASTILISYINEPFANANGKPHRHMVRSELENLFTALDSAVKALNPDRCIKHIDGDYDPPSSDLPDYHTYTMWYNGHGIEMGKVHRGYWLDLPEGWYCGCGEFGSEGLENVDFMYRHYPSEWLPHTKEEEKVWDPSKIIGSQSGNMSYFFYDRPNTMDEWVKRSQAHQAFGTKIQTEAFRRNANMSTFAIHLFIDAWPAGWMKTIVDCDRNPKPAFFVYRDALTPLMVNIRTDRFTYFENEVGSAEIWICNDTKLLSNGHKIRVELIDNDVAISSKTFNASFSDNSSFLQCNVDFKIPDTKGRKNLKLRAILLNKDDTVLHYCDQDITSFEQIVSKDDLECISFVEYKANEDKYLSKVNDGANIVVKISGNSTFNIAGSEIKCKSCGMRALNFISCSTNHPLCDGFDTNDFSYWYDDKADMITPIISYTFQCDDMTPVLSTGNSLSGSAWGKPIHKAHAMKEKKHGKGHIFVSTVEFENHMKNPICKTFANKITTFKD